MELTKHALLILALTLVLFLVLSFAIPFAHTAAYWVGFAGALIGFGVVAGAFARAFRKDTTLESKLLGWPIFKTSLVSMVVHVIAGIAVMGCAAFCPVWVAVIVEVVLIVICAICLTMKDAAREAVTAAEARVTDNTAAWKAIRARANAIAAETGHPDIKKLAEEIRYADPAPTGMDGDIAQMLETLSSYADAANIRKAQAMLAQRKALAQESKK